MRAKLLLLSFVSLSFRELREIEKKVYPLFVFAGPERLIAEVEHHT